jgi:pSer/pThr/pTyr-binding forkhead associated (FHA) protein
MIFYDAEGFGIIDLASTNGVELNGSAVTSALVKDGDAITLGKTTLQLAITG